VAAPLLRDVGYNATFYVTVEFLNQPGYLTSSQLRELHASGFEIGCHSMTHAFLTDCSPSQLQVEIVESLHHLQDQTGASVRHLSCPGGRWSPQVAEVALAAGYVSVATSRIGVNKTPPDRFQLRRIPVMRGVTAMTVGNLSKGKGVFRRRTGDVVRGTAKSLLGNTRYEALRDLVLRSAK
jgi:peptidoglycan/xylan/chitin deacetylase (PgdA/CDA1 family)